MARTVAEIEVVIDNAKAAKPELDSMNSPSDTAIWKKIRTVIAVACNTVEQLFDLFKAEVDAKVALRSYGTTRWWAAQMLEFRFGQQPQVINYAIAYPDPSQAPTVTRCAAVNRQDAQGARVLLKLAKGADDALVPLLPDELAGAIQYATEIQPAGVRFQCSSLSADRLKAEGVVYYDPLLPLAPLQAAVAAAMRTYLRSLSTQQNFNGKFYRSSLHDAMQAVAGVGNATHLTALTVTSVAAAGPVVVEQSHEAFSGYMVEDPDALFVDTLTWLPDADDE